MHPHPRASQFYKLSSPGESHSPLHAQLFILGIKKVKKHWTCLVEGDVVLAGVEGLCLAVDIEVPPPAAGVVMRTVILDVGNAPAETPDATQTTIDCQMLMESDQVCNVHTQQRD